MSARGLPALAPPLALLALVAAAYAPFLVAPYAYSDDYAGLWTTGDAGLGETPRMILRGGRLLYAPLYDLVFGACRSLADLRWVRALSAAGAGAAGIAAASLFERRGATRAEAWIAGAGVALLPAMVVPVAWASAFGSPWAAAGALLAASLWADARSRAQAGDRRGGVFRAGAALLLLLATLHLYQPAAHLWFVGLAAALAWAPAGGLRGALRETAIGTAAFAAVGMVHLALFRVALRVLGAEPDARARLVGLAELPEQLRWYLSEALPNALRVFVVDRRLAPALAVAAVALGGLALRFRRRGGPVALGLLACAALLPLSYASNLVTPQRWAALRTVGAPAAVAGLLAFAGALELAARWGRRTRWPALALSAALVVAQAVQVRERLAPRIVGLQLREMALVRERVRELVASGATWTVFRRAAWSDAGADLVVYDEIGVPSSSVAWVPRAMVHVLHRELTGAFYAGHVTVLGPEEPLREGAFTIDLRAEAGRLRAEGG